MAGGHEPQLYLMVTNKIVIMVWGVAFGWDARLKSMLLSGPCSPYSVFGGLDKRVTKMSIKKHH